MELFARMLQQALDVAESLDILQRKTGIGDSRAVQYSPLQTNTPVCAVATGCDPGWLLRSAESPSFCVTQIPSIDRSHRSGSFLERE